MNVQPVNNYGTFHGNKINNANVSFGKLKPTIEAKEFILKNFSTRQLKQYEKLAKKHENINIDVNIDNIYCKHSFDFSKVEWIQGNMYACVKCKDLNIDKTFEKSSLFSTQFTPIKKAAKYAESIFKRKQLLEK